MTSKRRRASTRNMQAVRPALFARSGGHCEHCAAPITIDSMHAHHRKLRTRGGDDSLGNLAALCAESHDWAHRNPAEATRRGFMVASWDDPETIPIGGVDA